MTYIDPKTNEAHTDERSDEEIAVVLANLKSSFANDLAAKLGKYGWSEKQRAWAYKLARENDNPSAAAPTLDASAVITMFDAAAQNLKYPKVEFFSAGTQTVAFVRINSGVNKGGVNINNGEKYGTPAAKWYGRINRDGSYSPPRSITPQINDLIESFAATPIETVATYGVSSGACCFCNKTLTHDTSKALGYGKRCANNYSLPWGAKAAAANEMDAPLFPADDSQDDECEYCGEKIVYGSHECYGTRGEEHHARMME